MSLFFEILLPPFVACLVLTGIHTYLGLHVVSRGVIFVDLALAQIAALGATFAFLLGYDPAGTAGYLYSLLFAFTGAAIFSLSRFEDQRVPQEAIIGITFAVASAAAILIADLAPQGAEFVEAMLTGALLWVPWPTILKTAAIYAGIGLFHWIYRERFLTVSLQPDVARERGWNLRWWDFLFYMSFGFVITSSVAMAGILLVFSFLVIPSVIAMLFARSIAVRLAIGWTVGTLVSMAGLSLSYLYDLPSGPAVVCTFGAALVLAAMARYVIRAPRAAPALVRVGLGVVGLSGVLWLAFSVAEIQHAPALADATPVVGDKTGGAAGGAAGAGAAGDEGVADVGELVARLREAGEAGEAPSPEVVAGLVALQSRIHTMIETGELQIDEAGTEALARVQGDGAVSEILEEFAFHYPDPWVRLRAAEGLARRRAIVGIPALIDILDSGAPGLVRAQAAQLLRQATGAEMGFELGAAPAAQREAVERWRAWWQDHRERPFLQPAETEGPPSESPGPPSESPGSPSGSVGLPSGPSP